jgi:hypothetical protein
MRRPAVSPLLTLFLALFAIVSGLSACGGSLNVTVSGTGQGSAGSRSVPLSSPPVSTPPLAAPTGSTPPPPADGAAQLHIVTGFTTVVITTGVIGSDLFRATTPPSSSGSLNTSAKNGVVAIAGGGSANLGVLVTLNPTVRWQISLDAGVQTATIDLSGGQTSGIAINQGVSSLAILLPRAVGTMVIALAAGVNQLQVYRPSTEAVRVTASGGAGTITVDGVTRSGVSAGSTVASPGWDGATGRVDIHCGAGVSSVDVAAS